MIKAIIFDFYGVIFRDGKLDNEVLELIGKLRGKYKLAVVSNINRIVFDEMMDSKTQAKFNALLLSSETGYYKPGEGAFINAAKMLNLKPEECLLIDDLQQNINGAVQTGMLGVLYKNPEQLKSELNKI